LTVLGGRTRGDQDLGDHFADQIAFGEAFGADLDRIGRQQAAARHQQDQYKKQST
jgi:hypothetical protein